MNYMYSTNDVHSLHTNLFSIFRKQNLDFQAIKSSRTVTTRRHQDVMTFSYVRPLSEAIIVERKMGLETSNSLDLRRHPVIELRAVTDGIILELVIAPEARCDQQNLVGKLSVERHRRYFRKMIARLHPDCRLGFWEGTHLDEMHLTANQLSYSTVFDQWMSTYADGQDWFRIGRWYPAEDIDEGFTSDIYRHAEMFYGFYNYIAWTGNNDYRAFHNDADVAYA